MEAKKAAKSFRYKNSLVWNRGRRGRTSAPGKPEMDVGSPPEFKGDPGIWSPEELLVGALNTCLMLTFVSLAQNKGVQFAAYESAAEGLLENVDGKYRITEVGVRNRQLEFSNFPARLQGPGSPDQVMSAPSAQANVLSICAGRPQFPIPEMDAESAHRRAGEGLVCHAAAASSSGLSSPSIVGSSSETVG